MVQVFRRTHFATFLLCIFFTLQCTKQIDYGPSLTPRGTDTHTRLSLFALGDTGFPLSENTAISNQYLVGDAMQRFDKKQPIDAVVFLGDLFYPVGLEAQRAVAQIRDNLVHPYCRFIALDGPRAREIQRACRTQFKKQHTVPLYAVLGNHDYGTPGSPDRTRTLIPQFVSNWHVPSEMAQVVELDAGVSLILFDSQRVRNHGENPSPLTDAIRASRGPWRILALHHPIATQSLDAKDASMQDAYVEKILSAISAAGVPVQLVLAGHEHNLQAIALTAPNPPLHLIAGGGANVRGARTRAENQLFFAQRLGFARIDLVETARTTRLVASLYALPAHPKLWGNAPTLAVRYSVDLAGQIQSEFKTDPQDFLP